MQIPRTRNEKKQAKKQKPQTSNQAEDEASQEEETDRVRQKRPEEEASQEEGTDGARQTRCQQFELFWAMLFVRRGFPGAMLLICFALFLQ